MGCYGAVHIGGGGEEEYSPVGAGVRGGGCGDGSFILSITIFRWGRHH